MSWNSFMVEKKKILNKSYNLVSFKDGGFDKKLYDIEIEGNKLKKMKRKVMHIKYYDYKVYPDF